MVASLLPLLPRAFLAPATPPTRLLSLLLQKFRSPLTVSPLLAHLFEKHQGRGERSLAVATAPSDRRPPDRPAPRLGALRLAPSFQACVAPYPLLLSQHELSPFFSYYSALFCPSQNPISCLFIHFHTLAAKHPGWYPFVDPAQSHCRPFPLPPLPPLSPQPPSLLPYRCAPPRKVPEFKLLPSTQRPGKPGNKSAPLGV